MAEKFAKALQFNKVEGDEFAKLVLFCQAEDAVERNRYFVDLMNTRLARKIQSGEIDRASWERLPNWLNWVLYSLVDQADVKFEPAAICTLLGNIASEESVAIALAQLFDSGILRREVDGEIVKGKELIPAAAAQDIPVDLVRKLQIDLMYLGMESLFKSEPTDREMGALTVALTEEEFNQIKFEVRQLRKRIAKDIMSKRIATKGDRLYQLNLQLFPLSGKE